MAGSKWEWPERVGVVYAAGFTAGLLRALERLLSHETAASLCGELAFVVDGGVIRALIAEVERTGELPEEAGDA
jgi:hypothetical protein